MFATGMAASLLPSGIIMPLAPKLTGRPIHIGVDLGDGSDAGYKFYYNGQQLEEWAFDSDTHNVVHRRIDASSNAGQVEERFGEWVARRWDQTMYAALVSAAVKEVQDPANLQILGRLRVPTYVLRRRLT